MRRTLMRYVNLTFALTLLQISPTMKKRAPTLEYFVELGEMNIGAMGRSPNFHYSWYIIRVRMDEFR